MKRENKKAFTMIELIFVIVIMGLLSKFGVEFLSQAYKGFIHSKINNELQANSAYAVEFISKRMQYRIKASTIAREDDNVTFESVVSYDDATANIIEWVGYDIDGFRAGYWSGIADINASGGNKLVLIGGNTLNERNLIRALSANATNEMFSTALFFNENVGSENVNKDGWGWESNVSYFDTQTNGSIHPVRRSTTQNLELRPRKGSGNDTVVGTDDNSWTGTTAYEHYQLAWSAYAVGIDNYNKKSVSNPNGTNTGDLTLWYDYQPWKGHRFNDDNSTSDLAGNTISSHTTKKVVIMQDVSTFQFVSQGSLFKIQVCVKSDLITDEEHSVCKEKTVF